ncbi:unnamed protein product [Staurois parvus]|uniref:Uncharacterized protein n=1 Tax=Staurois parvus TaxID=386267 RepID=A0ABN9CRF1_9NEOB|nr:unnamed protein product [Staurois parvus]
MRMEHIRPAPASEYASHSHQGKGQPVHINATYQCPSELPFRVTHQCHLSVPVSAAYQCHVSVLPCSAHQ